VANGAQLLKICRESGRAIRKAPWHFLLLQAPEAGFDIVEKTLTPLSESSPFLALLIILPLVWLLSALSISLTFASVQRMRKRQAPDWKKSVKDVRKHLGQILPASFLVGIVVLCGLLLLIPGIYFMAIYLFVPQIAMTYPKYPATTYLSISKAKVQPHLWTTCGLVTAIFIVDFLVYLFGETLGTWAGGMTLSPLGQNAILLSTKITLSLITSAAINLGVSYYYLELSAVPEKARK